MTSPRSPQESADNKRGSPGREALLADQRGGLQVAAASAPVAELLELFEIQSDEGPCVDTVNTGVPTIAHDLTTDADRWPRFAPRARAAGTRAVSALPLRLRTQVIGALNLFDATTGGLDETNQRIGQALADAATIGILTQRASRDSRLLTEQLQTALNSRIVIEQAKGMLAQYAGVPADVAYLALRSYARHHQRRLSELAVSLVEGTVPLDDIYGPTPPETNA